MSFAIRTSISSVRPVRDAIHSNHASATFPVYLYLESMAMCVMSAQKK